MRIQMKVGMSASKYNKYCTRLDATSDVFTKVLPVLFVSDKSLLYFTSSELIYCGLRATELNVVSCSCYISNVKHILISLLAVA